MTEPEEPNQAADAELVLRSRSGDRQAFAELWRRHYRSGVTVARTISPAADPDDLVQEAYTRIFHAVQRGGGPTGSFRAYLFTSIRNTAADWGRSRHETTIDELETLEDPSSTEQATADSLDRSLTHQAFRSLPSRWQEVLWYSEIEGMKPAQIAPLLGLKPTAVAQLAFRAREGLREAWVQAHLRSVADDSECAWAIARLGAYARENLARRDRPRLERHLRSCTRCMIVASEAQEVSSRLALVLIPLTIGAAGAAGYLASLQTGAPAIALTAMPSAVVEGAATAAGPGAAGAAASGTAVSSGLAAGSVAAGTAVTAGATGAAGGALTVGVGLAAAAVAIAGSVAAGVVLPQAGNEASVTPAVAEAATPTPAEAAENADGRGTGPSPSPSDIPTLSDPAGEAADGVQDASPGSTVALSNGNGSAGSNGNGSTGSNGNGTANGNGNANANGNGAANGNGNGNANANANAAAKDSAGGNADAVSNGNGNPGIPAGSPSVVSSSSEATGGATVVEVVVGGTPGATIEARIRGTVHATATVAGDGRVALTLRPTAQDIKVDARVDLRYVDGSASGPPLGIRLSALL